MGIKKAYECTLKKYNDFYFMMYNFSENLKKVFSVKWSKNLHFVRSEPNF